MQAQDDSFKRKFGISAANLDRNNTELSVWQERDRLHIELRTLKGKTIIQWWDEEAYQAFEDGFLDAGKKSIGDLSEDDDVLHDSIIEYVQSIYSLAS